MHHKSKPASERVSEQIIFGVRRATRDRIEQAAADQGVSRSELLRQLVDRGLDELAEDKAER